ncbi:MAG: tetratricopeptide repeat protein [Cyanobacteria bacterium SZAS LIN-2]|nr:tetratricopeptide repeat protein [Cyanobacteria bacterium SZAS LIN-3]MBS1997835.1 tetratricopeptide repeat protein [Cyanobacteria bacterium SZAS LIN-2]
MRKPVPTSRVSRFSSIVAAALWLFCAPKPAQAQGHTSETEPERLLQIHQDLLACAQSLGRKKETEEQFIWLLSKSPNNGVLHFNYACYLKMQGQMSIAIKHYKEAARLCPDNIEFARASSQAQGQRVQEHWDRPGYITSPIFLDGNADPLRYSIGGQAKDGCQE